MARWKWGMAAAMVGAMGAVVGCSGQSGSSGESTLDVWFNDPGTELQPVIQKVMTDFESSHDGVKINLRFVGGADTHQQYVTAVAGGAPPCVAQLGNTWTPEFADMGALAEVDLALDEAKQQYVGSMVDSATMDGKLYGYPYNVGNRAFVYRKDLLEKSGLQVPKTWEDVRAAAKKLDADNKAEGIAGFGVMGGEIWQFVPLVWNWGGEIAVREGDTWRATMNSPEARAAFEWYATLLTVDKLSPPDAANWVAADGTKAFALGKVAMGIYASFQLKSMLAQSPDLKDKVGVIELPVGPGGNNDTFAGGSNLVVFEDCPDFDDAMALVRHMAEPANVIGYTKGIGMLPASLAGIEQEQTSGSFADPLFKPFGDQAKHTRYVPADPSWGQVEGSGAIVNAMQALMGGNSDVNSVMEELNTEINEAFGK
ncbi:extracellular solute-binding protein [Plantactinospora sp. WMMB334]|uniref:extracellular solute-binding protein n=1 Tax=Plantactinospora sp. WMMB334 TaxID=3404119 RepID=UPI003B925A72